LPAEATLVKQLVTVLENTLYATNPVPEVRRFKHTNPVPEVRRFKIKSGNSNFIAWVPLGRVADGDAGMQQQRRAITAAFVMETTGAIHFTKSYLVIRGAHSARSIIENTCSEGLDRIFRKFEDLST